MKKNITLTELRKKLKNMFDCQTSIEVDKYTDEDVKKMNIDISIDNRSSVSMDVPYKDKKELYKALNILIDKWDFSYHLEFKNIQELKEFIPGYIKNDSLEMN